MHDPMTVAFEVKRPWPAPPTPGSKWRYFPPILTVWHVDPESDGTDDSCGFSFYRTTDADEQWVSKNAKRIWSDCFGYPSIDLTEASNQEVLYSIWCLVKVGYTKPRKGYIYRTLPKRERDTILNLCISPVDNLHSTITRARKPGPDGIDAMTGLLLVVIRIQRTMYRRWWERPKWHVHHWQIQIHAIQNLKRWLFSRCAICGGRFTWGYCPVSDGWGGSGPLWFKGEKGIRHHNCR